MIIKADEVNPILEEYQKAKKEGKHPKCPYCGKPLEIAQTQFTDIYWTWDEEAKRFLKDDSNGEADEPYCMNCDTQDWGFIDFDLVNF